MNKSTTTTKPADGAQSAITNTITCHAELTDTFSGEANYSWVTRRQFTISRDASVASIIRRAKSELGLTGVRCVRSDLGDMIELRPCGSCTVAFITFDY